ncbi:type II toxin-antitoxin system HicB family antitoxin [Niabella aquatica]
MKILNITIEKTSDHYSAYATNAKGVYGAGETPEEAKKSILEAIELLKKYNAPENLPAILKGDYTISFKFDAQSLLNYYKGIFTLASLERITGIDQKYLQHYSTGLKKPRPERCKKIEKALHNLGSELMALEL